MKLLVIVNATVDAEEVRDAIVDRAAAGPVQVTLVASASNGTDSTNGHARAATAQYVERLVKQLREAGVPVDGVVENPGSDPMAAIEDARDPLRFDEVVVSCRPWLSCRKPVRRSGAAGG